MEGRNMGRKGQAPEQIIAKLREAEVALAKGKTVAKTCRALGVRVSPYSSLAAAGRMAGEPQTH